jgi:FAD:protein FMN transferase
MVIQLDVRHERIHSSTVRHGNRLARECWSSSDMDRRSFLKLPTLLPLIDFGSACRYEPRHFGYESVLGTSMDLLICSPSSSIAEGACQTVLEEIDRLRSILDTRDPASEVSRLERADVDGPMSCDLSEVLSAYQHWERRTGGLFSIRPGGAGTPRNVDALGKAYIIDRAAAAALTAWPSIDALLLNIGGDLVTRGRSTEIAIADPSAWYDNAQPLATIEVRNAAVATSGTYARGAHLTDPRIGESPRTPVCATVIASDVVTANALATTLCLTSAHEGLRLVESTPGAEAMRVMAGVVERTSGFAMLARPAAAQAPSSAAWPPGYHMTVALPLTATRSAKRPYVAVWVDDASGKLVRSLALWGDKPKYWMDLSTLFNHVHGDVAPFRAVTRATRPSGKYELEWDGLDNDRKPVPQGTYRITIETNQEHGSYAKQTGTITIGDSPATITLPGTANFDPVHVQYGPK